MSCLKLECKYNNFTWPPWRSGSLLINIRLVSSTDGDLRLLSLSSRSPLQSFTYSSFFTRFLTLDFKLLTLSLDFSNLSLPLLLYLFRPSSVLTTDIGVTAHSSSTRKMLLEQCGVICPSFVITSTLVYLHVTIEWRKP